MDRQGPDSPRQHPRIRRACPEPSRRDGWTPKRQLGFLAALQRTRSVTKAAKAVGMSRESAYRLRERDDGGLFTPTWDRVLGSKVWRDDLAQIDEGHIKAVQAASGHEARHLRLARVAR